MDGIIFDVDGTIWDSRDLVARSWTSAIQENSDSDRVIDGKYLGTLFGKPMDEIFLSVFPDETPEERARLGQLCAKYEDQFLQKESGIVYDGVEETFKQLSEKTDLYIVSNCQCGYIEAMLRSTGLGKYVKDTLCFGQTQTSKGKTIRTLMECNNLKDVVYVGDTQGDADACKEANVPFIFAEYGLGASPEAEVRISCISELLEMEF